MGLRYTRAKQRNHFISFISLVAMIGIALGVAVLITVLSVMNGFSYEITTRFFDIAPELTVITREPIKTSWPLLQRQALPIKKVSSIAPYVAGKGMLSAQGRVSGVEVLGILPREEAKITVLASKMVLGSLESLQEKTFNMLIGNKLASSLGLNLGDKVVLLTPRTSTTPFGVVPRYKRFTISGIFKTNSGFDFDSGVAYIHLNDSEKLFGPQATRGVHMKLKNLDDVTEVTQILRQKLPDHYLVTNWMEQYGSFFKVIAMEKTIMFVILLLIIIVAAFTLVATLVMAVNDKRAEIAILRTIGASPLTVMMIFVVQGATVGLIGTMIGIIGGVILSLNATDLVNYVQQTFHVQFLQASINFVDFLPSRLAWQDVGNVSLIAMGLSFVATLYPASIAFRTQPVEALRYE